MKRAFISNRVLSPIRRLFRRPIRAAQPSRPLDRLVRPEAMARWLLPSLKNITPDYVENILRGAIAGSHVYQAELFQLMEDTWPRLAKNLNEIKHAVIKLDWRLEAWAEEDEPPSDSANEKKMFISQAVWRMDPDPARDGNAFEGTVYDLLDAWSTGTALLEIEWKHRDGIVPKSTYWIPARAYGWMQDGTLGLQTASMIPTFATLADTGLEPLSEDKFLVAISKSRSGHPLETALLRPLVWFWCAANFGAAWLLNFAQLFGQPIRWASYDPARTDLIPQIADMMENLGSSGWAIFPHGTTLDLKEATKSGQDNPQSYIIQLADKACDLLTLGQTLTTDVGQSGSLALGTVHQDVRQDVIEAAADFAAGIINRQLIPAILRLNYGDDSEAPYFCPEAKKADDSKQKADRDAVLRGSFPELEWPEEWFRERHGIPIPQPGEKTISGASQIQQGQPFGQPGFGPFFAPRGPQNQPPSNAPNGAPRNVPGPTLTGARQPALEPAIEKAAADPQAPAPSDIIAQRKAAVLAAAYRGALAPVRQIILDSSSPEDAKARMKKFFSDWHPEKVVAVTEEALQLAAAAVEPHPK